MQAAPGIFIDTYQLGKLPIPVLLDEYEALRQKCKEVFDFRWDSNVLWLTDIFGNAYKCHLAMNTSAGEILPEVLVTLYSAQGTHVFHECFKLDKDNRLTHTAIQELRSAMESYTGGNFRCAYCGSIDRRFGEGTGYAPNSEVCATCFAKPEIQDRIRRQFQEASR